MSDKTLMGSLVQHLQYVLAKVEFQRPHFFLMKIYIHYNLYVYGTEKDVNEMETFQQFHI